MIDIPAHLFCSNPSWFCKNNTDLITFFNKNFPLPNYTSWTVLVPSIAVSMKVISVLWMRHFEMGEWIQLKKAGKHVGKIGVLLSDIWEWSFVYRMKRTSIKFSDPQALQLAYAWVAMVKGNKLQLAQSQGRSRLLA